MHRWTNNKKIEKNNDSLYQEKENLVIDEISTAGAVKMLTEKGWSQALLKSLQISVETRGAREINLYIHEDCKYYAIKDKLLEKTTQINDARIARQIILKKFKRYKIVVNIWWIDKEKGVTVVI
jgi:hypothetical protein